MRRNLFILLGLGLFFGLALPIPAATAQPQGFSWKELAPGLAFNRWPVKSGDQILDTIVILRLKPDQWAFKVFYNATPKTLQEWQQATGAPIVVNGGFFQENFRPAGRILAGGTTFGPLRNKAMKGMFLAEPKKGWEQNPKARLIDLKDEGVEETMAQYEQGIQSFPVLLDPKGQVRVNPSSFQANRTVIAQDSQGNILILVTEKPFFTLYDLGNYLKKMPLGLTFALNMDGGYRTQLSVQLKNFKYLQGGQGETQEPARLFFPEGAVKLPSVIGIFPRGGPS